MTAGLPIIITGRLQPLCWNFLFIIYENIIENFGYKVVGEAEDGEECIKKYKELKPDIVSMDITMPYLLI